MRFALRTSVRVQLALVILLAIILSWVLSGGLSNYIGYLHMMAIRQEMLSNPTIYPVPIEDTGFGIRDFLLGPRRPNEPRREGPPPGPRPENMSPGRNDRPGEPFDGGRPESPGVRGSEPQPRPRGPGDHHPPPDMPSAMQLAIVRILIAVLLAVIMGRWVSKGFTKPLTQLSEGANAYHSGDFKYRIPATGGREFADVAQAMNEMAARVSEQIEHLEDDASRRRQFLADAAHELRSPVTTMRTMAGALADGTADDPQRSALAIDALVRTSERLLRLVNDMMELAKLDLKELPLRVAEVDLSSLISDVFQAHQEEIRDADMTCQVSVPDHPVMAEVDADRISQVLDNLLNNAISYAGEGADITATLEDGDPGA